MSKDKRPHLEVILPIFNEVKNILPLLEQFDVIKKELRSEATMSFLFVNDGSVDGSKELLHRLFRQRDDIRVVDLVHNFGHSAAISCGFEYFSGDVAVLMDADQQDDPTVIPQMFAAWKQGHRTVVAERGDRQERGRIFFRLFYFLLHRFSPSLPRIKFGTFSLLDKSVIKRFRLLRERNRYIPGLVTFASDKIAAIKVDRQARAHGKSRVGIFGLFHLALTAFLSFSNAPVRLVSLMGLVASATAILSGLSIVGIKLFTQLAIPGWASIMTATAFWSGIQLLCLGIIGEYIARMYDEVKRRPLYLVDNLLQHQSSQKTKEIAS